MITRAQMRRQMRAKGGIMNVAPREKFGLGSKLKDRFRKLIPNELADIAVKAAPFVAMIPGYGPAAAAAMRGIGRFDQRGSISDALKQAAGTYAGGKLFGTGMEKFGLRDPGASGIGDFFNQGTRDRASSFFKGGEKSTDLKESTFFDDATVEGLDKVKTPATGKGVGFIRDATGLFKDVPILKDLPSLVQQQILVGGATSAATYLYSAFIAEEPPQQEGETMKEYLDRRKVNVGKKMRAYFDNYFKFDKEYSAMTDEQKDAFVARQNVMSGGRAGYQTGGITMANTLAENIKRNLANQQAVGGMFEAARSRLPGYVAPQITPVQEYAMSDNSILGPLSKQAASTIIEGQDKSKAALDVLNQTMTPTSAGEAGGIITDGPNRYRINADGSRTMIGSIEEGSPGPGGIDNLLPDLYEKVIGPAEPPKEGRVVKKPIDIVDFYKEVTKPDEKPVATLPGITMPGGDEAFITQPGFPDSDGDGIDDRLSDEEKERRLNPIEGGKLEAPTSPLYNDPLPYDQLIAGFAEWKRNNPDKVSNIGTMAIVPVTLPGGYEMTFPGGAEASNMRQYLESIGQAPMQRRTQPIESIGGGLSKLAPMGPMSIMPPMAPEGGGEFPGGIMIDGKKYFSEQEAIKDMGVEKYNQFMADGGRVGFSDGSNLKIKLKQIGYEDTLLDRMSIKELRELLDSEKGTFTDQGTYREPANMGGIMGMPMGEPRVNQGGITELDYRAKGGFVPVGIKEKADDVPAMLSKNEFVFTADAVRGAGNGSIEKGAQKMYDTMKNLERRVT